jgi:glycine C-acetyltransferase
MNVTANSNTDLINYYKTSLLDYYSQPGKDIFSTAREFKKFIDWTKDNQYYYVRRTSTEGSDPHIKIFDKEAGKEKTMLNFASNEYLNLVKHPETVKAGLEALNKYGIGAGSAPMLGGTVSVHDELEQKVASFKSCEDAIIFTSGYSANSGSLLALLKEEDLAIVDQYAHASINDGCKKATVRTFKHNDIDSLESILRINSKANFRTKMICIDGVYSMDGDIANLPGIYEMAKKYNAYIFMDDAHATGVIGKTGRGTAEHFDMEGLVDIVSGTFSKALGCVGGFIASKFELVEYLRFYARSYLFSTAMTPQAAASLIAGINVILNEPGRRTKLWKNINYLKNELVKLGFNLGNAETAIFPIIIGDNRKVYNLVKYMHENGIYVNYATYPAVPVDLIRLRISVMQGHTIEDLDNLIYHLKLKSQELNII